MRLLILSAAAAALPLVSASASPVYALDPVWPTGFAGLNASQVTAVAAVRPPSATPFVVVAQRNVAEAFFLVFDAGAGALVRKWAPAEVQSPHGLFWSPAAPSSLFVTDIANATVLEFDATTGAVLNMVGTPGVHGAGTSPMQFSAPADIALTARGALLVSDGDGGTDNRVSALNRSSTPFGELLWTVGKMGSGPSDLDSPHSVAYLTGPSLVVVADRGNARLQFLNSNTGTVVGSWAASECFGARNATAATPWGVRADSRRGVLFVADGVSGTLDVFAAGNGDGWRCVRVVRRSAPGRGSFSIHPRPSLTPPAHRSPLSENNVPPCAGALLQTLDVPGGKTDKPHEMAVDEVTGDVYIACVAVPPTIVRYQLAAELA